MDLPTSYSTTTESVDQPTAEQRDLTILKYIARCILYKLKLAP